MSNEDLIIELSTPIKVAEKGDEVEIDFITLSPPTGKIAGLCANIKSAFFSAISKLPANSEQESVENADIKGSEMIQIMYMSGADMGKVIVTAKALIKEVGLIGGEKNVTMPMIDRMSPDDIDLCLGEYMANFILKSALLAMKSD